MKKVMILLIIFCAGVLNVNADTIYYTNSYGVTFTEQQYVFFSKMYYEGFQEYMTKDDFDCFEVDMMNPDLVESVYTTDIISRATSINDGNKNLKISKTSNDTSSSISVIATWNVSPNVKSYDVIGARLDGVLLKNIPKTKFVSSTGSANFDVSVSNANGFGTSVPISGNDIKVAQTFMVSNGGKVYASYQHAKSTISFTNSKRYSISASGYGRVFAFYGVAASTYDKMNGVYISV